MLSGLSNWDPQAAGILEILARAEITDCKLLPSGSNYVFLVGLGDAEVGEGLGVYKPERGEAPLWDFPDGSLYRRERAAYLLACDLGWNFIPPTVIRDGPHGIGTVQLFIPHDPRENYFTLRDSCQPALRQMALFDVVANNADRKGGHCLRDAGGRIWGIDHGLTFHASNKLRTVIWDFADDPIPADLLADLGALAGRLENPHASIRAELGALLHRSEIEALCARVDEVLRRPVFPRPGARRAVPWPPV
jgi:uncharacterized repeat protein (TIGR03843 family)